MALPIIYPILEYLQGAGAALGIHREEPSYYPDWSLRDNPIGRTLHWLADPKWGGFATAMAYSPGRVVRMPDGSYYGYQPYNNPDGTFGSYIRPNTLPEVVKFATISSRLYNNEAPDSVPARTGSANSPADTADTTRTAAPAPTPQPERNDSNNNQIKPSLRERIGDRIAGRRTGQSTSNRGATPPNDNQSRSLLERALWERKGNHFGQGQDPFVGWDWWKWRNVGRVGLGFSYPARERLWPAVGQGIKYMAVGPDSVPSAQSQATTHSAAQQVDSNYVAPEQYVAPTDTLDF